MTKSIFFFRLDANQATVIVGLVEIFFITSFYFTVGAVGGAVVQAIKNGAIDAIDDSESKKFDDLQLYAVMGALFLVFLVPLIFSILLFIGALKSNRCMMMPWIINGVMRAIVGSLLFFVMFAFPIGSGAQVFFFFSHGIYYAMTVYSLNAVCRNYTQMQLRESQNLALSEAEKLLPTTTLDCDAIEIESQIS